MSLWEQFKSFNQVFWIANSMEMIERLAYYGLRAVASAEDKKHKAPMASAWSSSEAAFLVAGQSEEVAASVVEVERGGSG